MRCIAALCLSLCLALAACATPGGVARTSASKTAGGAPTSPPTSTTVTPTDFSAMWHTAPGPLVVNTVTQPALSGAASLIGASGYGFALSNPQIGYACVGVGASTTLYATRDGGLSWSKLIPPPFTSCNDVFVDTQDASDVFATQEDRSDPSVFRELLWRSRDAGATWRRVGLPPVQYGALIDQVAVVGSRLFISASPAGMAKPANTLYASDDDGATWRPLAQTIVNEGYLPLHFTTLGATLYISGVHAQGHDNTTYFWRSTDTGNSWTLVTFPGLLPVFVPAASGSGYYALSVEEDENASFTAHATITTFWWSADGGATWRKLPALAGVENGYVAGGGRVIALAPDGSVFSQAEHSVPNSEANAFGIYRIQPNAAAPTWQPFAATGLQQYGASWWQAVQTSAGVRLWGVENDPNGQQSYLEYTASN